MQLKIYTDEVEGVSKRMGQKSFGIRGRLLRYIFL